MVDEQWWLSLLMFLVPSKQLLSLLKALVNGHCGLAYADVEPPQPGCVCEPKLPRGKISRWEEQGVFSILGIP